MANTNSQGSAPGGHGGSQVSTPSGQGRASADAERAAQITERNRQAAIARGQQAATKTRVKSAARRHIGPLK